MPYFHNLLDILPCHPALGVGSTGGLLCVKWENGRGVIWERRGLTQPGTVETPGPHTPPPPSAAPLDRHKPAVSPPAITPAQRPRAHTPAILTTRSATRSREPPPFAHLSITQCISQSEFNSQTLRVREHSCCNGAVHPGKHGEPPPPN